MTPERLAGLVRGFPRSRIAVLGDFFLDKYLDVDPGCAEVSLETGRTAHQVLSVRCSPGAAGTVVNNLAALSAGRVYPIGFTGDDGEGYELRRALGALGCDVAGLVSVADRFTPTYLKPRDRHSPDLSGEHDRYDTKNRAATPLRTQEAVLAHLARLLPDLDAVIVVDQVDEPECGIVTRRVREELAVLAGRFPDKLFWADSRRRVGLFRQVIVKVNVGEALREVGGPPAAEATDALALHALSELGRRTGKPVFLTAGSRGTWVGDGRSAELVPAVRVAEPTDPTGAGDSATAGAVLALCAGATLREAAVVANLVASITIQQLATTGTASPDQLVPRLQSWRSQNEGHQDEVRD